MKSVTSTRERSRGPSLRSLQDLIYRLVTAPTGVAAGLRDAGPLRAGGLESLVRGDQRMSAIDRVEIYANMYFYRLLGVLKEDYPATLAVTGDDNFHNLVTSYLVEYPPTEPSVYFAGRHFPALLADYPPPFLAELALLERTMLEVFHAAEATRLDAAMMRAIPPSDWSALVMRTHPAVALLDCRWSVGDVLRAVECNSPWREPAHQPVSILVWRNQSRVHYREIEPAEHAALNSASGGAAFATICEAATAALSPDANSAEVIHAMLARWLADGIVSRSEPD